ncbi:MAG: hypothetical protein P8008_02890, partial [Gammaproteobacteria bacterium]
MTVHGCFKLAGLASYSGEFMRSTTMPPALLLFCCLALLPPALAQSAPPSIDDEVESLQPMEGYFDLYWDGEAGRLMLRVGNVGEEFIYQSSMPRGVGSNDLGLDRGQLGANRLVAFERHGPRLLLKEKNLAYRASAENVAERAAVESSFAPPCS